MPLPVWRKRRSNRARSGRWSSSTVIPTRHLTKHREPARQWVTILPDRQRIRVLLGRTRLRWISLTSRNRGREPTWSNCGSRPS